MSETRRPKSKARRQRSVRERVLQAALDHSALENQRLREMIVFLTTTAVHDATEMNFMRARVLDHEPRLKRHI